jgi:hypothetical protein
MGKARIPLPAPQSPLKVSILEASIVPQTGTSRLPLTG